MPDTENIRKPDFFIVGAAKAGTTALYDFLSQHPGIYMSPVKEPHFFSRDIDLSLLRKKVKQRIEAEDMDAYFRSGMNRIIHRAYIREQSVYLRLFENAGSDKKAGEASPSYLYSKVAAREIREFNPEARIIILLRQPAKRAYSHYLMDRKLGFTSSSFSVALEEDRMHSPKGWGANSLYLELGFYFEQVKRYLDVFPENQVMVLLQEDLTVRYEDTLRKVFKFLEVDDSIALWPAEKINESVIPSGTVSTFLLRSGALRVKARNLIRNKWLKKHIQQLLYKKAGITAEDEKMIRVLTAEYRSDIERLSVLINRDLSLWLQ
jgi:hypothetical protein